MAANKFTFKLDNSDKSLQVGLQMVHDDAGRADLIHEYEEHKVRELLQPNKDFEVTRYRHAPWEGDSNNASDPSPPIEYSFIFNDPNTGGWPSLPLFPPVVGATQFGYNLQGFNNLDISIRKESFLRSFFKLDLYQTPDRAKQKLYISKIIDTISGRKIQTETIDYNGDGIGDPPLLGPDTQLITAFPEVVIQTYRDIDVPEFRFYMTNDSEFIPNKKNVNHYIYWLKEKEFLDIGTFYMKAKFFNGENGKTVEFLNTSPVGLGNSFSQETYFYYRVELNRNNYTYQIFDDNNGGVRIGIPGSPITYYQYVNL